MLTLNPKMLPRLDELEEDLLARRERAAVRGRPLWAQGRDHRVAEGSTLPKGTHQADTQLDRLPSATVAGGVFHGPLLRQEVVRVGG
ncbi:hypothetical protein [Streptomyces sp. NPDC002044]|uniref:hypothetical protein n=1 Tax=Streptomyces sp. NPDC002044 TaxID=3154662 RepID=UPI00332DF6DC